MQILIQKRDNRAVVRIPETVLAAAGIAIGQPVNVRAESGRIVIEPLGAPRYALNDLLDQMASEAFPDPLGAENWVGRFRKGSTAAIELDPDRDEPCG